VKTIATIKKPRRAARSAKKTAPPADDSLARAIAEAALAMKAEEVVILDVTGILDYTDHFVIASGRSTRQAQAIAENIQRAALTAGARVHGVEGEEDGNWILVDAGTVIAHVFYHPVRMFYDLEKLWGDAKKTTVKDQ
jgi:ribosome-associated protein